jgi:hypothetical protein
MGDLPRMFREGKAYCETQRTVDRAYLFKPDEIVRQIIGSSAGRALEKHPVKIYYLEFNINHMHRGIQPLSTKPEDLRHFFEFTKMFNSLIAKGINRHLDREGPVFSTHVRAAEAQCDQSLEQQLFYAVTNVVKDGLVEEAAHWKGFSLHNQMATGDIEKFYYIDYAAWRKAGGPKSGKPASAFMKTTTVELTPLPSQATWKPDKRQAHFRREVRNLEQFHRENREREHKTVVGRTALAQVDPRDRPKTRPIRTPKPKCHATTKAALDEYLKDYGAFLNVYYVASEEWMSGIWTAEFPTGCFRPPNPIIAHT